MKVAERALYYWNSEHLCVNVLSQSKAPIFLPFVFGTSQSQSCLKEVYVCIYVCICCEGPLSKSASGHWNQAVEGLAQSILKMYVIPLSYLLQC